jgi:hypothetical protein
MLSAGVGTNPATNIPWLLESMELACTTTEAEAVVDQISYTYQTCTLTAAYEQDTDDVVMTESACFAIINNLELVQSGTCAITGGTGTFAGATGQTLFTTSNKGTEANPVFLFESTSTFCTY